MRASMWRAYILLYISCDFAPFIYEKKTVLGIWESCKCLAVSKANDLLVICQLYLSLWNLLGFSMHNPQCECSLNRLWNPILHQAINTLLLRLLRSPPQGHYLYYHFTGWKFTQNLIWWSDSARSKSKNWILVNICKTLTFGFQLFIKAIIEWFTK